MKKKTGRIDRGKKKADKIHEYFGEYNVVY